MKKYSFYQHVAYHNKQAYFTKEIDYAELINMLSMHWKQCPGYHLAMRELALKTLLMQHSKPLYQENLLKKGDRLVIVGPSVFKQKKLQKRLSEFGIEIDRSITEKTTHVLLNTNPSTTKGLEKHTCTLLSDQQLQATLDELEQPYLQEEDEETQHSVDHLRSLLMSNDDDNIMLAIQIIEGGGFPTELVPELFIAMKFSNSKQVYQHSKKILNKYLSVPAQKAIQRTLSLSRYMKENYLTKNLKKYTDRVDDLDGTSIAKVLYKHYKMGIQYIWKHSNDTDLIKKTIEDHLDGTTLNVSNKGITILPKELAQYQKIERVILKNNALKSVPKILAKLPNITHLDVSGNYYLERVSQCLCEMKALKELNYMAGIRYYVDPELSKFKRLCQEVPLERLILRRLNFRDGHEEVEKELKEVLADCEIIFK